MSALFEPKLDMPVGAIAPDIFDANIGQVPSDDFVVSRNRDGSVVSLYGDLSWNLSAYHPEGQPYILNFVYWNTGGFTLVRDQISREARYIFFLLMWMRDKSPLSIGTLRNYLTVIRVLSQYAEDLSLRIQDILKSEEHLWSFIAAQNSGWLIETLGSLLPLLARIRSEQHGFEIVGDRQLEAIRKHSRSYRATLKQHAPMPTRIYSKIISNLLNELSQWELVSKDLLLLMQECYNAKKPNKRTNYNRIFAHQSSTSLNYMTANGRSATVKSLSALISETQATAKLIIQTFTGMRDDEAVSLPYHCLEETVSGGRVHYVVLGRTTKLNGGRIKRTRWVTNQEGHRAIKAAQQIADMIYSLFGVSAQKSTARTNDHPLFVSIGHLGVAGFTVKPDGGRYRAGQIYLEVMKDLRFRLEPLIEEVDICELEQIDPHRAWRSEEKFQVGNPWLFTSHQLRRSLALYAQRSGLVSLPSLRRQLQHITNEMSSYYAKGSAFAKDFIGEDNKHFGQEWRETQPESASLSYVLNVLMSTDVLFGGHASWVEHRLKGSNEIILVDREVTLKRFKKGEIDYKETLIGGCVNVGECDKPALNWLQIDCLRQNCRNLVVNLPKLERVIAAQERMIGLLDQSTVEYRTEKSDLDVLIKARDDAMKKSKRD